MLSKKIACGWAHPCHLGPDTLTTSSLPQNITVIPESSSWLWLSPATLSQLRPLRRSWEKACRAETHIYENGEMAEVGLLRWGYAVAKGFRKKNASMGSYKVLGGNIERWKLETQQQCSRNVPCPTWWLTAWPARTHQVCCLGHCAY